jgi:CheY-like chemotaxis protein
VIESSHAPAPLSSKTPEQALYDVLVSDVAMPEDDGYDLIRNARALAR